MQTTKLRVPLFPSSLLSLPLLALVAEPAAQSYDPPFNHTPTQLRAVHGWVIATGPAAIRGKALVWDYGEIDATADPGRSLDRTRWAIIDPEAPAGQRIVAESVLQHDPLSGDLGCAGHATDRHGRLIVAGGTKYSFLAPNIVGAKHMYIFDPRLYNPNDLNAMWVQQDQDLDRFRWYPSVFQIAELNNLLEPRVVIFGGDGASGLGQEYPNFTNTYEAFRPPVGTQVPDPQGSFQTQPKRLFDGPPEGSSVVTKALGLYPCFHLVADGRLVWTGMRKETAYLRHHIPGQEEVFSALGVANCGQWYRFYGCSLLLPNLNAAWTNSVMILGGSSSPCTEPPCTAFHGVQVCKGAFFTTANGYWPGSARWTDFMDDTFHVCEDINDPWPNMNERRANAIALVLPDGSIIAIGGVYQDGYQLCIERFRDGMWMLDTIPGASPRGWHAIAVLLPSGAVLLAGADTRANDYQLYRPWYMSRPRPAIVSVNSGQSTLGYNMDFVVKYTAPPGVIVSKVVLMRPGSVTHSTDFDQRYVELEPSPDIVGLPGDIWVRTPMVRPGIITNDPNLSSAPRGWYMIFVVSSTGVPSVAEWVHLNQ